MPVANAQAIRARIAAYAQNPTAPSNVKKLKGKKNDYRLRHGDWRAVFTVQLGVMTVLAVKHRREIYRR